MREETKVSGYAQATSTQRLAGIVTYEMPNIANYPPCFKCFAMLQRLYIFHHSQTHELLHIFPECLPVLGGTFSIEWFRLSGDFSEQVKE